MTKKKSKNEPERKLLGTKGELWRPRPAPELDEHDRPIGRDADESPFEDDD